MWSYAKKAWENVIRGVKMSLVRWIGPNVQLTWCIFWVEHRREKEKREKAKERKKERREGKKGLGRGEQWEAKIKEVLLIIYI